MVATCASFCSLHCVSHACLPFSIGRREERRPRQRRRQQGVFAMCLCCARVLQPRTLAPRPSSVPAVLILERRQP